MANRLNEEIELFLKERGAVRVGFATPETLAGAPPSGDLSYIMPEARAAISFALALDRDKIRAFLGKRDFLSHEQDNIMVNLRISQVGKELAAWLEEAGHAAKRLHANLVYRKDQPDWQMKLHPDLSHRYVAVASGVGSFGWSGNVGVPGYGTAVILGTVVTAAPLEPTEPIPAEESFCRRCKLCAASCASGMFDKEETSTVTIGSREHEYSRRHDYLLCDFVCGGFTGLHPSGEWSTWSPGRYTIPRGERELYDTFFRSVGNYVHWPERSDGLGGGYENPALPGVKIRLTCANCQIICWGDEAATCENYRILTQAGCVLQREDGTIEVLPGDEAAAAFDALDPGHRARYQ